MAKCIIDEDRIDEIAYNVSRIQEIGALKTFLSPENDFENNFSNLFVDASIAINRLAEEYSTRLVKVLIDIKKS
jgi:hypothetical protein